MEISITEATSGEICIVLENVAGGLERNVSVTLTTTAVTAGTYFKQYLMDTMPSFKRVKEFNLTLVQ